MAFDPPDGILDIGNATLRVGKLEVAETSGLNQGLQNIIKNDLLITENNESSPYTTNQKWGLKLPTTWVAEFEVKGHSGKYIDFNFYNENSASNAQGYNLTFKDTSLTLKYDGGNNLPITGDTVDSTLSPGDAGYGVATIPTIVGAYRKVNIFFERGVISVSIDGTRYLYHKESDGYNAVHGHPGVASRVVSATGSAFVNVFIEQDASNSAFKNLRIVNGRFISDKTSNIAFIGGNLGVGVNSPKETLDIRGNMHFNRVSNVSQIKVDSNVVTEYTGPHDRPLRKYPEVAMTSASQGGYVVTTSNEDTGTAQAFWAFNHAINDSTNSWRNNGSPYTNGVWNSSQTASTTENSNTHVGHWIQLYSPTKHSLKNHTISARSVATYRHPFSGVVLGSIDGSTWNLLDTWTSTNVNGINRNITIDNTTRYSYFRLVVIGLEAFSDAVRVDIGEWELYGHEEGSGSLDTTLKSVYNVPATTGTQLEVYYDAKDLTTMPGTVTDLAGGDQNGTAGSSVTLTDGAFVFDGTTNGKITTSIINDSGDWVHSASVWVKVETGQVVATSAYISLLGTTDSASTRIAFDYKEDESAIRLGINSAYIQWNNVIVPNHWHHITYTYKGGSISGENYNLYVDGKYVEHSTTLNDTAILTLAQNTNLSLGQSHLATNYLKGSIANFRLYSKALNADQVKELYDYQKDYFLGSKSQVTLYKGHLGVGVTEPSGQLELAGDERIQEYPPRAMTGWETYMEGHGVFRAGKSGHDDYLGNWDRWKVFNKGFTTSGGVAGDSYHGEQSYSSSTGLYTGVGTQIESLGGISGDYFILDMPYKISLKHINVTSSNQDRSPTEFIILGSNDGSTWTQIKHFSSAFTGAGQTLPFQVNSNEYFSYFGLVVTKIVASNGYLMLSEWQLFGTPGPTTLDKGSLTLGRSLDVPRISRYDVDTETPRPEKLLIDLDTTVGDTGRGATDISGRANHLTPINSASFYSVENKAYSFDGSTGVKYEGAATGYLGGTNPFSISLWFKSTDSSRSLQTVVGLGNYSGSPNNTMTGIRIQNDGKVGVLHYNNDLITTSASLFEFNSWNHVVYVFNGSTAVAEQKLYINGVNVEVTGSFHTGASLLTPANANFSLGTWAVDNTNMFKGFISQPKLYSVALEPSEVQKLYRLGRTGRSMVISDTAVGIGKVPEAQLDVRGSGGFTGDLTVGGNMNNYQYWFRGNRNGQNTNGATAGSLLVIQYDGIAGSYTSAWTGSNKYTCPEAGVYMTHGNFMAFPNTANSGYHWVEVRRYNSSGAQLDGGSANDMHTPYRDNVYQSWHFQQTHLCNKGDQLQIMYRASSANAHLDLHAAWGNVNIYKIG